MPALTLLFLIYFGLAPLGIVLHAFTAAVVGARPERRCLSGRGLSRRASRRSIPASARRRR